jgi:hypothetical protein
MILMDNNQEQLELGEVLRRSQGRKEGRKRWRGKYEGRNGAGT